MKSTLKQQHPDCLDRVYVEDGGERVKIVVEYYDGVIPNSDDLTEIRNSGFTRCDFDKASFIEFLENTLAMLKVG